MEQHELLWRPWLNLEERRLTGRGAFYVHESKLWLAKWFSSRYRFDLTLARLAVFLPNCTFYFASCVGDGLLSRLMQFAALELIIWQPRTLLLLLKCMIERNAYLSESYG